MENSVLNIVNWGMTRNLHKFSSVPVQLVKFAEEVLEFDLAESQDQKDDAIGDSLVVLINMIAVDVNNKNQYTEEEVRDLIIKEYRKGHAYFERGEDRFVFNGYYILKKIIRDQMSPLEGFAALAWSLDKPEKYLDKAYEEIKDRKGQFTPDGNFVKEEDL